MSLRALQVAKEKFLSGLGNPEKTKFVVDDFQREAISSVIEGQDTLVVAPTGSGKTFIAMECIRSLLELKLRAVYTTPLKALSNSKYNEMKGAFEPRYKAGILTGDRKISGDADVVVATTEIYRNELYRTTERYSLVVLDEVHYISDPQRGPVWEESIILTPSSTTLLMLSASISNAEEIAAWLEFVRGKKCRVVIKQHRPVELRLGFLHPEYGAIPLAAPDGRLLPEVRNFYGSSEVDASSTRIRGGRFAGSGQSRGAGDRAPRFRNNSRGRK